MIHSVGRSRIMSTVSANNPKNFGTQPYVLVLIVVWQTLILRIILELDRSADRQIISHRVNVHLDFVDNHEKNETLYSKLQEEKTELEMIFGKNTNKMILKLIETVNKIFNNDINMSTKGLINFELDLDATMIKSNSNTNILGQKNLFETNVMCILTNGFECEFKNDYGALSSSTQIPTPHLDAFTYCIFYVNNLYSNIYLVLMRSEMKWLIKQIQTIFVMMHTTIQYHIQYQYLHLKQQLYIIDLKLDS